jgi:hypothetical protein
MSAINFSVQQLYRNQGNVQVNRTAREELEILLYHNRIINYIAETDRDGQRHERAILDGCGKPTLTTARAMNRGLSELGFPGRVRLDNGTLVYSNHRGVKMPLITPLTIDREGHVHLLDPYYEAFKDLEVTLLDENGAVIPEPEAALA